MISLGEILAIEDDPAFGELACGVTGILAWPVIRADVLRLVISDLYYPSAPLITLHGTNRASRVLGNAIRSVGHSHSHPPEPSDVLILSTGAGLTESAGRSRNSLADPFADLIGPRAWSIEGVFQDRWPTSPRENQRISITGLERLRLSIEPRIRRPRSQGGTLQSILKLVGERAERHLGWSLSQERRTALLELGTRRLDQYVVQRSITAKWIDAVRPKLALVEEASYGHMAVIVATLRAAGVRVAEFQHGIITQGHDAYNVAPTLAAQQAYRRTLPDMFLSYGQRWNDLFNIPISDRIVIGNPRRSDALASWQPVAQRTRVIVLGDGIETAAFLALTAQISRTLGTGWDVRFRPHPLERFGMQSGVDVGIDESPMYESLASAHAVIGESSTVLFEAIGLVQHVIVWDTPKSRFYLKDHDFERAATVDEIAALVRLHTESPGPTSKEWWADAWRDRFQSFLKMVIS